MNTLLQMLLNQQGGAQALPNSFVDAVANGQGWGKLAPISQVPMSEDDAGNQYAANGSIIRKGVAPGSMTWGEAALAGATAPAKLATGLASTLSPYGSEGFQVPPILAEPVRAGNRLLNSGGFPDPQDPQNQQDAVTSLLSFFGANAFGGARAGAGAAAALSDTSRPSVMGSAVGAAEQQPSRSYHGTRYDVTGRFIPSDDGLLGPGVYSSINPSEAQTFAGHNRGSLNNPIWNYEYGKMFPFDVAQPIATDADWMRVLSNIEGSGTSVDQPRSVAIQAQNALVNEGFGSVRHGDTINTFKPGSITSPLTGEVLFSDTSRPSLLGSAVAAEQAPTKGITAYHGSPHDFDKFDMSKIGTGEGAQAYGHGLYFAEREGVAQSYRKNLSKPFSHAKWLADDGRVLDPYTNPADMAAVRLRSQAEDIDAAIRSFKSEINSSKASDDGTFWRKNYVLERLEQALGHLQKGTQTKLLPFGDGHMYQVRINADPNDFLDWDKPLSQQPRNVRQLMRYIGSDTGERLDDLYAGDWLSSYARSAMADETGETLESMLKRRGVPGIKYLDQMSRNAGDGSRNYVVFNADDVEILRKYGLLAPLFASGMLQAGDEQ